MRRTCRYWIAPYSGDVLDAEPGKPVPPHHILLDTGSIELTDEDKEDLSGVLRFIGIEPWDEPGDSLIYDLIMDEIALFLARRCGGCYVPTLSRN